MTLSSRQAVTVIFATRQKQARRDRGNHLPHQKTVYSRHLSNMAKSQRIQDI